MDDLLKIVLSVAAAALVGVLVFIGVVPRNTPGNNNSNTITESGSFVIQQAGQLYGREDFILSLTDQQSDLHSTLDLNQAGQNVRFTQRLRMMPNLDPVRYFRDTTDGRSAVLVEFQADQVQLNVFNNGQAQAEQFTGTAPFVVLDRDVFSHYLLLYRKMQQQNGRFTGTIILPQAKEIIELQLISSNPINLRTGSQAIQVEQQTIQIGNLQVFLYTQASELIAVGLPDQQIFAYRSDLFPEALQAP